MEKRKASYDKMNKFLKMCQSEGNLLPRSSYFFTYISLYFLKISSVFMMIVENSLLAYIHNILVYKHSLLYKLNQLPKISQFIMLFPAANSQKIVIEDFKHSKPKRI